MRHPQMCFVFIALAVSCAPTQGDSPVERVADGDTYTVDVRSYADGKVQGYRRMYKVPPEEGRGKLADVPPQAAVNMVILQEETDRPGLALLVEFVFEDGARQAYFRESKDYFLTLDTYAGRGEAVVVMSYKDGKVVAVIGRDEDGVFDLNDDKELIELARKYHPQALWPAADRRDVP